MYFNEDSKLRNGEKLTDSLSLDDQRDHLIHHILLLALHCAQVADVALGFLAVFPHHLVSVHGTFPLQDLQQGFHQRVIRKRRSLQVGLDVLVTE